jgi:hypothetical protein
MFLSEQVDQHVFISASVVLVVIFSKICAMIKDHCCVGLFDTWVSFLKTVFVMNFALIHFIQILRWVPSTFREEINFAVFVFVFSSR